MQVIDLSQGEGIKSGLKTLADALTPDPDKAMRSAYLQQQAQKTGAETARLERQNELATQNASIWANNGGAAGLAKNPALLHIYQANELEGLNHENADNALKFFSGSYAQDPTTMSQTPMGGGPSVPQALMAPGGIAPPRGGSSAGAGPIASAAEQFRDKVTAAARMHGVDPDLAMRVLSAESGGNPAAVSQKGAKGLFQLTDGTAGDLHVADPFNPDQNIDGGVRYIKQMHDMFGGDTRQAMAAYNWGPGNVQKLGMAHMPAETRGYLAKLGLNDGTLVASAGELPPGSLAGASPAPQAPSQSPVAPTQGVNSPGVSQVPAGITDPYMERLAYMGTGVPHARDTFTGMQMDQANDIQKQFIQHPGGGAGTDKWGNSVEGKAWAAKQAAEGLTDQQIAQGILDNRQPGQLVEVTDPQTGEKRKMWLNRNQLGAEPGATQVGPDGQPVQGPPKGGVVTGQEKIQQWEHDTRGYADSAAASLSALDHVSKPSLVQSSLARPTTPPATTGVMDSLKREAVSKAQDQNSRDLGREGRNFIHAILRDETGASISQTEWETYWDKFIPTSSDSEDDIARKSFLRHRAVASLGDFAPGDTATHKTNVNKAMEGWESEWNAQRQKGGSAAPAAGGDANSMAEAVLRRQGILK